MFPDIPYRRPRGACVDSSDAGAHGGLPGSYFFRRAWYVATVLRWRLANPLDVAQSSSCAYCTEPGWFAAMAASPQTSVAPRSAVAATFCAASIPVDRVADIASVGRAGVARVIARPRATVGTASKDKSFIVVA